MRSLRLVPIIVLVGALTGACSKPAPAPDPQMVAQWMRSSLSFVRSERLGPPVASRISAYAGVALYEGYAADSASALVSLSGQLNGLPPLPVAGGEPPAPT